MLAIKSETKCEFFNFNVDKSMITTISFSPLGNLIASGNINGNITIHNLINNSFCKKIGYLEYHQFSVTSLVFSPDEKYLVSGSSDKTVYMFNLDKSSKNYMKQEKCYQSHNDVLSVHFSFDGKYLFYINKSFNLSINKIDNREEFGIYTRGYIISSACFSPFDDFFVVGGSTGDVIVVCLDLNFTKIFKRYTIGKHDNGKVNAICISPLAEFIASTGRDEQVNIYTYNNDTRTYNLTLKIINCKYIINSLCFSFGNKEGISLAIGGNIKKLEVFNLKYELLTNFKEEQVKSENIDKKVKFNLSAGITCVKYSHDYRYIAAGIKSGKLSLFV